MSDDEVLHYLRGRGQVQPPPDFIGAVIDAIGEVPQRRATWFAPFLPAAALLGAAAALAVAVVLLNRPPSIGPTPEPSTSRLPSASASPNPSPSSTPEVIGDQLLRRGDMIEMPAIDGLGEWGTIRLERGDELVPSDSAWSTHEGGSVIIEIHVRYTAARYTEQSFGIMDWGVRVQDGIEIRPARRDPERPPDRSLTDRAFASADSVTDGWIALEVPIIAETSGIVLTYQGIRPGGPTSMPLREVLVRQRQRNAPPTEGADLLEPGNATLLAAVSRDGSFGTITLDRGHEVGGYPLVLDPSSETHFFLEILATYELDRVPAGTEFGELDWRLESANGAVQAELLDPFPPVPRRVSLGQWPGATVPEDLYRGWMLFAIPRDAAGLNLDLVYQPAGVDEATRIPVRSAGEPPAPVPAEWPYRAPVYVEKAGLPFTVIESAEADALFIDADTCTNPEAGYTVSYPDSWYTNTALENVPACSWFSPTYYELNDSGDRPEEIAIEIRVIEGAIGFIWVDLYSEQLTLDGFDARRAETGRTKEAETPTDVFQYSYLAYLDAESEGRKLWAFTGTDYAGDYELNKAVFDRIMASLRFDE